MGQSPPSVAYRLRKLATPTALAPAGLPRLQAGVRWASWPSRKYATRTVSIPALISPSPSALGVSATNLNPAERLSAREISRSPEVRCDGPAQAGARQQSLTVSPPFLAVLPLSFLHLQPELDQAADGFRVTWGIGLLMRPSIDLFAELFWQAKGGRRHLPRRRAPALFLSYGN
jgi:hypothetical protein